MSIIRSNSNSTQPKRNVIDLQPVQIDVQLSQKITSSNHLYQLHLNQTTDSNIAQKYVQILNESIETILLHLAQKSMIQLPVLNELMEINKVKFSHIAVLNLQIIPKLTFILERCANNHANVDLELIRNQVKYWKGFVVFSLSEYSQEIQKYGPIKKQTDIKSGQTMKKLKSQNQNKLKKSQVIVWKKSQHGSKRHEPLVEVIVKRIQQKHHNNNQIKNEIKNQVNIQSKQVKDEVNNQENNEVKNQQVQISQNSQSNRPRRSKSNYRHGDSSSLNNSQFIQKNL